jgi:hypothetical protein
VDVPDKPKDDGTDPTGPLDGPDTKSKPITPTGRVSKLMDELEMALRRDEVDPKMLEDLGWNVDQAWQFVEDYKRQIGRGQRQSNESALPDATGALPAGPKDRADVRRATTGPAPNSRSLSASNSPGADRVHDLREIGRQRVPRPLDPILRGYNSSFGTRPAE